MTSAVDMARTRCRGSLSLLQMQNYELLLAKSNVERLQGHLE